MSEKLPVPAWAPLASAIAVSDNLTSGEFDDGTPGIRSSSETGSESAIATCGWPLTPSVACSVPRRRPAGSLVVSETTPGRLGSAGNVTTTLSE